MKKIINQILLTIIFLTIEYCLSKLEIPLAGSLLIVRFTYLIGMLYACYFKIEWCIMFGILGDVVPFLLFPPSYPFFIGYTISAVLKMMTYRYFFYLGGVSFKDIVMCRLCVNTLINMLLGALWIYMMYTGDNFIYYFGTSLLKNLLLVPIESVCFYLVYNIVKRADESIGKKLVK